MVINRRVCREKQRNKVMGENSKIEWTDHTFNPWIGCTKVSPECLNCYAEVSTRARVLRAQGQETWGKGAVRSRTGAESWKQPLRWNRQAGQSAGAPIGTREGACGPRPKVFCASLADWLDSEVPAEWLADLLNLIEATPNLDWQLLTKRPRNWEMRVHAASGRSAMARRWRNGEAPENVWVGTTVGDGPRTERIPELLQIPAKVRFLSCEPLLGAVGLYGALKTCGAFPAKYQHWSEAPASEVRWSVQSLLPAGWRPGIHWVICGGESGSEARPMHPDWARALRDQCQVAGVPFFFKQWGEWAPDEAIDPSGDALYRWPSGEPRWESAAVGMDGKWGPRADDLKQPSERVWKCGKKAAGRLLDGREWNGMPKVA
jgi:protein gp37